jgi:hypothetical protein
VEYLAECLWPGVTAADVADLDQRARAVAGRSPSVRYLGSLRVPVDEVVFCFFEAASVDDVREAAGEARIPFERIVESVRS